MQYLPFSIGIQSNYNFISSDPSNLFILSKYARVMIAIDMSLKTENDKCAVWVTNVDLLNSIILGQNDAFKVKYLWLSSKQDC